MYVLPYPCGSDLICDTRSVLGLIIKELIFAHYLRRRQCMQVRPDAVDADSQLSTLYELLDQYLVVLLKRLFYSRHYLLHGLNLAYP